MDRIRAGLVVALTLLFTSGFLVLSHFNGTDIGERVNTVAFTLLPLSGAVLLARQPHNPVGYLVAGVGLAVLGAGAMYEVAALRLHPATAAFPFTDEAAWASMNLWTVVLPSLVMILLLFPDGHLPGRRWRLLVCANILITLPVFILGSVIAWRNRDVIVFMDAGQIPYNAEMILINQVYDIWNLALIGIIILALIGFISRFLRSKGIERQQLKWFVFGLSTIPASMVLEEFLVLVNSPLMDGFVFVLNIVSIAAFPVVMLIAITRYRLYDIDFIIRRTLLYSSLTLTLALMYIGLVLVMQGLFTQRFGEQPAFVIVLSTLLIAAMFQPLRRRFQSIIDRRFYRSKYNGELILQDFSTFLQHEVNLDEIERHFIAIVEENIQPEQTELWLVRKSHT